MSDGFNPLQDLASILGNLAKVLPPLPTPPFQPPKAPAPEVKPSGGYVDITDSLVEKQMEKHGAAQAAKGLITLHYE